MKPHARLSSAIRAAVDRGEPALVAFMTAGFPQVDKFAEHLHAVASVADVVEIGVPFTDPMADGMTIQRSSQAALKQGVSLKWILGELATMQRPEAPLVLMSYLNPLLQYGYARLAQDAAAAGVCGFIVPDLPFDEGDEFRAALVKEGVALVQMVTPVTTPERLARVCAASEGFVYAVTMTGTTGKSVTVPDEVLQYLARVKAVSPVPLCGFRHSFSRAGRAPAGPRGRGRGRFRTRRGARARGRRCNLAAELARRLIDRCGVAAVNDRYGLPSWRMTDARLRWSVRRSSDSRMIVCPSSARYYSVSRRIVATPRRYLDPHAVSRLEPRSSQRRFAVDPVGPLLGGLVGINHPG